MRLALIAAVLLAGCARAPESATPVPPQAAGNAIQESGGPETPEAPPSARARWDLQSSGEGAALVIGDASGDTVLRLFCPAGSGKWLVNVPAFRAIGSEERFSFGNATQVATLVADAAGDAARGGVTGEGPVPRDLAILLSGRVAASYGRQVSGPHAAPPSDLANAFTGACLDVASSTGAPSPPHLRSPAPPAPATPPSAPARAGACLMQDGRPIAANALRAVGTEPFWGARVDGRCVTYSHPDDPSGTRVWTSFSGTASNGTWTGALGGKPFVLRTHAATCSDGMSDTRYPITVSLTVGGEQRSGCATAR